MKGVRRKRALASSSIDRDRSDREKFFVDAKGDIYSATISVSETFESQNMQVFEPNE